MANQLQALLDETDALDPIQSGFRQRHGTKTTLVALLDDLIREADRGKMSLLVLLDISATFDTVDHGIILGRLSELWIGGLALAWLRSFLEGHPQRVQLGENVSALWSLSCGVPQGLISPMLFNIYMRLLGEGDVIWGCGASCHQYADDTQLYISFFLICCGCCSVPWALPGGRSAMDAVEWTKVKPRQDRGSASGEPRCQWFGELPLFFGGG